MAYAESMGLNDRKAVVMRFNGNGWEYVGRRGFSEGEIGFISIALDQGGTPYVAFEDYSKDFGNKASVMKFNGDDWEYVGNRGFSTDEVEDISFALAQDGTPYVVFNEYRVDPYYGKAAVMKFTDGKWEYVGDPGFSAGAISTPQIALTQDGTPYVVYKDAWNGGKATVMKFTGDDWEPVGNPGFSPGSVSWPAIALDKNGTPYVAFVDGAFGSKATVMRFNGDFWEYVGGPGFSQNWINYPAIALDNNGIPYVIYQDYSKSSKATVMRYDGSRWGSVGVSGFSDGSAYYTKIVPDDGGTIYVAFQEVLTSAGAYGNTTVMKYVPEPVKVIAAAASAVPETGADNEITLTVINEFDFADLTFDGTYNVTITGYSQAPDGTYGSIGDIDGQNETELTEEAGTIQAKFEHGVARLNLKLHHAAAQHIVFGVEGLEALETASVTITPSAGRLSALILKQDIEAPLANGGPFARQPIVELADRFGNIRTDDNVTEVTAMKHDDGDWQLTGTKTVTAREGVAEFTDLGARSSVGVTGAQLVFQADGIHVASQAVDLPWPEPDAPHIYAVEAGDGRVKIKWHEVPGTVTYAVYQRTASETYGDATALVSGTEYEAGGLVNGTTYYFIVKAMNPSGTSPASNEVSAVPNRAPAQGSDPGPGPGSDNQEPTQPEQTPEPQPEQSPEQEPGQTEDDTPAPGGVYHPHAVNEPEFIQRFASITEEAIAAAEEATAAKVFTDTKGHWAQETIDLFASLNLIAGYEDGTFRPDQPITRAEFAALLYRVFVAQDNGQDNGKPHATLNDIEGHWAEKEIEALVSAGIITGYPDGTFRPNQPITREEMVVILSRLVNLDHLEKDETKGHFRDLDGTYATDVIVAAAQAGLINGSGNGIFDPKSHATRAEALQIIRNALELHPQIKPLLDSLRK